MARAIRGQGPSHRVSAGPEPRRTENEKKNEKRNGFVGLFVRFSRLVGDQTGALPRDHA